MELILWRHCDAEAGVPDELRALTPRGRAEAARMAEWLRDRLPVACRVFVSPAVRARQTAEALGLPFETRSDVAPGASVLDVLRVAGWPDAAATTLVVGHEPTLAKGGVVWLASRPLDADGAEGTIVAETSPQSLARS